MVSPRVVSLLPAATEALCAMGGERLLVGRSHECDVPRSIGHIPVLTAPRIRADADPAAIDRAVRESINAGQSLYTLDEPALRALRPDLILTQNLCSVCAIDADHLRKIAAELRGADGGPVRTVSLAPYTVEDVLDSVLVVAEAVGLSSRAVPVVVGLRERLFAAAEYVNPFESLGNVLFLEWTDPAFCAGHWTVQLIERAGGTHALNPTVARPGHGTAAGPQQGERVAGPSRVISREEIIASEPARIIFCPCGFDLERAVVTAQEFLSQRWTRGLPAARAGRIAVVDGNLHFNRPGPRLADAFEWLVGWLNDRPNLIPPGFEWKPL